MVWTSFRDRGANQRGFGHTKLQEVSRSRMAGPPASDDPTL